MNKSVEPVYSVAQHRLRRIFVLVVLAGAVGVLLYFYASCNAPSPRGSSCTTCPPSSLRPGKTCAKGKYALHKDRKGDTMLGAQLTGADTPASDAGIGDTPDVDPTDMPNNGLSPASLVHNQALLQALAKGSLTQDVFTAGSPVDAQAWLNLLTTAYAPDLARYVVSCALDPCEYVSIPEGDALAPWRRQFPDGFPGELGLCSESYNTSPQGKTHTESSWAARKPTKACLERVSSCVLARINAVEARVSISMRGDGMKLLTKVPVATQFRENHGTPIQSFKPCDKMCLWGDPKRRNCDWEPRYVGQCVRGSRHGTEVRKVRLKLNAGTKARVRICKGIYGCDDTDPALGAGAATAPVFSHGQFVEFPTYYGGQMIGASSEHTIEFDCPDDGPLVPGGPNEMRTGYYSVMLGSLDPGVPLAPGTDVTLDTSALGPGDPSATHDKYPAPESQVFTYREGGFFGSIFPSPTAPTPTVDATCPEKLPSSDQFACYSNLWTPGAAVFTARFCAGPTSQTSDCLGSSPTNCDPKVPPSAPVSACKPHPDAGNTSSLVYDNCEAASLTFDHPYTTYLNHPCDLFSSDQACGPFLSAATKGAVLIRTLPQDTRAAAPGGAGTSIPGDAGSSIPGDAKPEIPRDAKPEIPRDAKPEIPR